MRIIEVHRQHAQPIADEIDHEVIGQNAQILLEDVAFFGLFDVTFDHLNALRLDHFRDRKQQTQDVFKVLLDLLGASENLLNVGAHAL